MGNLQELVYKQGAAGVMKATVTIIFNNQDVAGSPVGYESKKEITVTRQVNNFQRILDPNLNISLNPGCYWWQE